MGQGDIEYIVRNVSDYMRSRDDLNPSGQFVYEDDNFEFDDRDQFLNGGNFVSWRSRVSTLFRNDIEDFEPRPSTQGKS